jgi:hypothetical protein
VVDSPAEGTLPSEEIAAAGHAHHWLIGGQDGPASEAVCKLCGAHRDFDNGYRYANRYRYATQTRRSAPVQTQELG